LSFFANFLINHGTEPLLNACDKIQPGILFMVLKSEGDKLKYITSPFRDKKYAIIAFSQLIIDTMLTIPSDVLSILVTSLIELCTSSISGNQGMLSF